MDGWVVFLIVVLVILVGVGVVIFLKNLGRNREKSVYERGLKMVPLLVHLPPTTDDIQGGGRDERDITNEALSQAQVMYSIISSTFKDDRRNRFLGQDHFSFEIVAVHKSIRYFILVPQDKAEVVKQAVVSAYPTARLEEVDRENIFSEENGIEGVSGGELELKKEYIYPINTYEDSKKDASLAILNAMSNVKEGEGMAVQILLRPAGNDWIKNSKERTQKIQEGKAKKTVWSSGGSLFMDIVRAPFEVPEEHEKNKKEEIKPLTNLQQEEIAAIENKTKYPAFEVLIRLVASSASKARSEAMLSGVVSAFSQFDSPSYNGFKINMMVDAKKLARDYILRVFPCKVRTNILNSVELASIYHLPEQSAIPNSRVERQAVKQVDGPAKMGTEGLLLGVNEFGGEKKDIYLTDDDRRRHMYVIGQTGMGKSVFLENLAYQDMLAGRGFAFLDPHGDAVEKLLQLVPQERIDDVIYFDPSDIEHPVGMNMFEYTSEEQKDFIVQEGISMLQGLFDPNNQGYFGPRGQHMFRNAALLLMSDPKGATFIDIPQCFTDPEFVKEKLKYVTDKAVYDYWTKEFPASQRSNEAGDVISWFSSKWGAFVANTIMRNTLGQVKSGFNIREIMDNKKIFLVNLSKGKLGDLNANLLGMIFVMKFQQAAMSRQNILEKDRQDFCLFVDEFQNFATDSFESILSEARKYRLNLIVANQFMTQLTDKIREALLGNCGTIVCGRIGITDAEMMVKAFTPTFTAEDLTKTPNYASITKMIIFGVPSSPFTMKLPAPMGEPNVELMNTLKVYSATRFGRTRAAVEKEINERWNSAQKSQESAKKMPPEAPESVSEPSRTQNKVVEPVEPSENKTAENEPQVAGKEGELLTKWLEKKKEMGEKPQKSQESAKKMPPEAPESVSEPSRTQNKVVEPSKNKTAENEPQVAGKEGEELMEEEKRHKISDSADVQEGVIRFR